MALSEGDKAWIENLFLKGVWEAIGEHEKRCVNGIRKEIRLRSWQLLTIIAVGGGIGGGLVKLFSALGG